MLVDKGVNEQQIREGSVPESSLVNLFSVLENRFKNLPLLNALHIGNFVGISLTYIANSLKKLNANSVIVSVDPDIPHRGVNFPQQYVNYLLTAFGLQKMNIVLTGFTLEKNIGDDGGGIYFSNLNEEKHYLTDYIATYMLYKLLNLDLNFNLSIIDGNHEQNYLEREIKLVNKLLSKNGILVLDDANENWEEVNSVYKKILLQPDYS
jgi:hypothetical protein